MNTPQARTVIGGFSFSDQALACERGRVRSWLREGASEILPGRGRATYLVFDPQLPEERPDALIMTAPPRAVEAYRQSPFRLHNIYDGFIRRLFGLGTPGGFELVARLAPLVGRSLGVHLAFRAGKGNVEILTGLRFEAGNAAILIPGWSRGTSQVSDRGTSVLFPDRSIWWALNRSSSLAGPEPLHLRAWLIETLARGLDDGTAEKIQPVGPRALMRAERARLAALLEVDPADVEAALRAMPRSYNTR